VRLVRTDKHGSQSKCRHQIGSANKKVCFSEKAERVETCGTKHHGGEVALEADACYIHIGRHQILGHPFLPCLILSEEYASELLEDSKELIEWQTLFANIIRAAEDSSLDTVNTGLVDLWQANLSMPLRSLGRIRTRLVSPPAEDSEISIKARTPGIHAPNTPEINVHFSVEPEAYKECENNPKMASSTELYGWQTMELCSTQ
jgi:hypothetical protein